MASFPIQYFTEVDPQFVVDIVKNEERLYENKSQGSEAPYYVFALTSKAIGHDEAMEISGHLDWYKDSLRNFTLNNPLKSVRSHSGLYLANAASEGDEEIEIAGLPVSTAKAVWGGDFIQFDNDSKGYRLAFSENSTAAGTCTATLTQPLLQAMASGTPIAYGANVEFQVCVKSRQGGEFGIKSSGRVVFDIELMEQK
ncbi:hypothetical protein A6F57_19830 [Alteromonas stellipolaris]|uniref:hypothetical protein n=1 Tax=Alteromonas stellipolaris TaxID=233316 RepID=UPI0007B453FC|nr:hypothetical protein [Alteromonas stellipolaris]ANB27231.1 hypothetical protein A6F57_19830 [Alteromonas stellipolaris]